MNKSLQHSLPSELEQTFMYKQILFHQRIIDKIREKTEKTT